MPIRYGHYVVSSGVTSSGLSLLRGYTETVLSGGIASATSVGYGAEVYVSNGGLTFDDMVFSGGVETVSAGGVAHRTIVSSGGVVQGGGELDGAQIYGTVSGVTIANDVVVNGLTTSFRFTVLQSGGVLSSATVGGGGGYGFQDELLVEGGAAYGIKVSSAYVVVDSGFVDGATVSSGSTLQINTGGSSFYSIVSGGYDENYGGLDEAPTVSSGGVLENIYGSAFAARISSGGVAYEESIDSGTTIYAGGSETVESGGVASGATLSGGTLVASHGGTVAGASVVSGGVLVLESGALASNDTVYGGGAVDLVDAYVVSGETFILSTSYVSAVVANGVTVAGGMVILDDPTVASGGVLSLTTGASTTGVTVLHGGVVDGPGELQGDQDPSYDYGLVSGVRLGDGAGGHAQLLVESGGLVSAVTEGGAGDDLVVLSGGLAAGVRVTAAQALFIVDKGGAASRTVLAQAGTSDLVFGAATGTVIDAGGTEYIQAGGSSVSASVAGGGSEVVSSGGVAVAARVASGGSLSLTSGASASGALVSAGGVVVNNGVLTYSGTASGTLSGTLTGSGRIVEDGSGVLKIGGPAAGFHGSSVISGGSIDLSTALGGSVVFAGASATLKVEATDRPASGGTFATTLADLDTSTTKLDLIGLAFVTGATASLSGHTLTLHDGAYTALFTLSDAAASKYVVASDNAGGTLIRASAAATKTPLVHAMAAFGADVSPGWLDRPGGGQAGHADELFAIRPSSAARLA